METIVTMYRRIGPDELELIRASGFTKWPPRLPGQPIFYPVTNEEYAVQIARDWNVKASGSGFVTRFQVRKSFMDRYAVQKVGGGTHTEWWIPAEDLDELNYNLVGSIEILRELGGPRTRKNDRGLHTLQSRAASTRPPATKSMGGLIKAFRNTFNFPRLSMPGRSTAAGLRTAE